MTTELTNQQIREIALANGFKLKAQTESRMDLNPYVYDFARALVAEAMQLSINSPQEQTK